MCHETVKKEKIPLSECLQYNMLFQKTSISLTLRALSFAPTFPISFEIPVFAHTHTLKISFRNLAFKTSSNSLEFPVTLLWGQGMEIFRNRTLLIIVIIRHRNSAMHAEW